MRLQENFRKNLRTFIEQNGISQRRLGELSGVHFTFISSVLQGQSCPSLEVVEKLSKAVGVPAETLFLNVREFARWMESSQQAVA